MLNHSFWEEIRRENAEKRNLERVKPKMEMKEGSRPSLQTENIEDRENENYSFNSLNI